MTEQSDGDWKMMGHPYYNPIIGIAVGLSVAIAITALYFIALAGFTQPEGDPHRLAPGMTREQVEAIMGAPRTEDNRWIHTEAGGRRSYSDLRWSGCAAIFAPSCRQRVFVEIRDGVVITVLVTE